MIDYKIVEDGLEYDAQTQMSKKYLGVEVDVNGEKVLLRGKDITDMYDTMHAIINKLYSRMFE